VNIHGKYRQASPLVTIVVRRWYFPSPGTDSWICSRLCSVLGIWLWLGLLRLWLWL